ncbi:MAG: restriction endonuclease subunit S [Spirochaetia bacterium]|nr:restriction endonuclease subunit S [Spirochaetia bacterium]
MARLGDVIEQIRGVSYKPSDLNDNLSDDSVVLLRANNIQDGKIVLDDVVYVSKSKVSESQFLRQGDILVCTSSGSKELVGKAAFIDEDLPMVFGAFCKVVRPKIECCKYVGHFFQSPYYRNYISAASAGANINNLRNEHIADLHIPLPSLEEQRKIAAVLDKVSDLIAKRRTQLDKLDELVKSRFIEMFGDPVLNPLDWQKNTLETNATLVNGRAYRQDELLDNGKYPVLRVGNFFSNRGWYYSDLELEEDKYCDNGDLLYAWSASFGPQIWHGGKVIYHYHIWKVLVENAYNKLFLCKLLEYTTTSLMGETHGIAMMHLTKSGMEKTEFIVPPLELQEQFAAFVGQTEKTKTAISHSLQKLGTLKKALMQEYFG